MHLKLQRLRSALQTILAAIVLAALLLACNSQTATTTSKEPTVEKGSVHLTETSIKENAINLKELFDKVRLVNDKTDYKTIYTFSPSDSEKSYNPHGKLVKMDERVALSEDCRKKLGLDEFSYVVKIERFGKCYKILFQTVDGADYGSHFAYKFPLELIVSDTNGVFHDKSLNGRLLSEGSSHKAALRKGTISSGEEGYYGIESYLFKDDSLLSTVESGTPDGTKNTKIYKYIFTECKPTLVFQDSIISKEEPQ